MKVKRILAVAFILLLVILAICYKTTKQQPPAPPLMPPDFPIAPVMHPVPNLPPVPASAPAPVPTRKKPIPRLTVKPTVKVRAPLPVPVAASVQVPVAPVPVPEPPTPKEWKGKDTAITHPGEVVIAKDEAWIRFWADHHPHEAAPEVDFEHTMVIGVFAGSRPADAFSIEIVNVKVTAGALLVDYQEKTPPPGTFAIGVDVYPYNLKVIPRSNLRVKFNRLAPAGSP